MSTNWSLAPRLSMLFVEEPPLLLLEVAAWILERAATVRRREKVRRKE